MALIVKRRIKLTTDGIDVAKMLVVAKTAAQGEVSYADFVGSDATPKIITFVPAQLEYYLNLPDDLPVTEGQYYIGCAPQDAAGNVGDITQKQYFFDFTAPAALLLEIL
jgi:hypothetical protein